MIKRDFLSRVGLTTLVILFVLAAARTVPTISRADKTAAQPLDAAAVREQALQVLGTIPGKMPGAEKDTPGRIELGRKLYFETRLSENNQQSCNSCHAIDRNRAGVDNQPTSPGAFGKRGGRNSPTTWNAGFHIAQFWDGRASDLKEQAKGPVLNPIEMAMPNEALVIQRLRADPEYPKLFEAAFSGEPAPLNYENVAGAIAAFERTLITRDRFDDFLKGNDRSLNRSELQGLDTFLTMGCTACHNGPLIGGNSYQKVGLVKPYKNQTDLGRFVVTKEEDDKLKFKVPSLRNVTETYPYFHDGAVASIREAVRSMASLQLGLELTPEQENSLVAFLAALTGKQLSADQTPARSSAGGN